MRETSVSEVTFADVLDTGLRHALDILPNGSIGVSMLLIRPRYVHIRMPSGLRSVSIAAVKTEIVDDRQRSWVDPDSPTQSPTLHV